MLHEPAQDSGPDYALAYKTRLGVSMFILYALVYSGFVIINIVKPLLMENIICLGLNLAVVYGFGLIIFALFLALIYTHMCSTKEKELSKAAQEKGGK